MGTCRVCDGCGEVDPTTANRRANIEAIEGYCFIGSGPRSYDFFGPGTRMGMQP